MATLLYSATASLDGYIAGPGGDMSWLTEHLGEGDPTADRLLAVVGALLVGHRTFGGDDPNRGTEQEGGVRRPLRRPRRRPGARGVEDRLGKSNRHDVTAFPASVDISGTGLAEARHRRYPSTWRPGAVRSAGGGLPMTGETTAIGVLGPPGPDGGPLTRGRPRSDR